MLEPPEGARRLSDERFCLVIGPERRWASVSRLRLADDRSSVHAAVADARRLVGDVGQVVWSIGSSASPVSLPEQLRALGLRDPDPPLETSIVAMVLQDEPPAVEGVETRAIRDLDDHLAGLEIMLASATWTAAQAAAERERARETFERRQRRGGLQWLALLDGVPVAYASAIRASCGLYLEGGSTLPHARGHGCYRALVRARWDEAARAGTPGLAVQAQRGSSAPILRRLGFETVAGVTVLQS